MNFNRALIDALQRLRPPRVFVEYMGTTYLSSETLLEVSHERTQPITVTRAVRQGDPLYTVIFSMVVNRILQKLQL